MEHFIRVLFSLFRHSLWLDVRHWILLFIIEFQSSIWLHFILRLDPTTFLDLLSSLDRAKDINNIQYNNIYCTLNYVFKLARLYRWLFT